jgi:hypothetical protein
MVLTDKAIFIAHAGAQKMSAQGYWWEPSRYIRGKVSVHSPAGKKYQVNVTAGRHLSAYCTCPFHLENGICKHRVWASEELDREAADVARWEAEAEKG